MTAEEALEIRVTRHASHVTLTRNHSVHALLLRVLRVAVEVEERWLAGVEPRVPEHLVSLGVEQELGVVVHRPGPKTCASLIQTKHRHSATWKLYWRATNLLTRWQTSRRYNVYL